MREQDIGSLMRSVPTEKLSSWLFSETVTPIEIEFKLAGVHKFIKCTLEEYLIYNDSSDENINVMDREQIVKKHKFGARRTKQLT